MSWVVWLGVYETFSIAVPKAIDRSIGEEFGK